MLKLVEKGDRFMSATLSKSDPLMILQTWEGHIIDKITILKHEGSEGIAVVVYMEGEVYLADIKPVEGGSVYINKTPFLISNVYELENELAMVGQSGYLEIESLVDFRLLASLEEGSGGEKVYKWIIDSEDNGLTHEELIEQARPRTQEEMAEMMKGAHTLVYEGEEFPMIGDYGRVMKNVGTILESEGS